MSNCLFFRMTWTIRSEARAATLTTTTTTTTTATATKTAAATILDQTNTIDTNKQKKKNLFQLFLHDGRILLTNIKFKSYVFHT